MFEAEIARGALLLDKEIPGWRNQLILDELDVQDIYKCVLGQLGHFDVPNFLPLDEVGTHGFDQYKGQSHYATLTEEWKSFLRETS